MFGIFRNKKEIDSKKELDLDELKKKELLDASEFGYQSYLEKQLTHNFLEGLLIPRISQKYNQPERSKREDSSIKWIAISKEFPPMHTWVLLGYWNESEKLMAFKIGRFVPPTGLEFLDGVCQFASYGSTGTAEFEAKYSTHWLKIAIYEEMRCSEHDSIRS